MNRRIIFIIVFGMLILASACVQQDIEPLIGDGDSMATENPAGDEIQLQQEGIGPLEITPDTSGGERSFAPPNEGDGGNINSLGERTTSEEGSGEPGMIESKAASGLTLEGEVSQALNWLTYRDQTYLFSIAYPESYIILPDKDSANMNAPEMLQQVRFLDKQLASADTADLEIPNFTVEVYQLGNQTLETFLDTNLDGGEREIFHLGDRSGIRVFSNQLIAPNEFYYFSDHGFVYKLTPLGMYAQEMLHSFKIK